MEDVRNSKTMRHRTMQRSGHVNSQEFSPIKPPKIKHSLFKKSSRPKIKVSPSRHLLKEKSVESRKNLRASSGELSEGRGVQTNLGMVYQDSQVSLRNQIRNILLSAKKDVK